MSTTLHLTAWLTLALGGQIQDAQAKGEPPLVLVPPALAAELKLSEQQRTKVDALEKEFQTQHKTAMMMTMLKVKTIMDKVERDEESAPALAIASAVTSSLLELKRTRANYEKKLLEMLDQEQQQKFRAWQKLKPKEKRAEAVVAPHNTQLAVEMYRLTAPRRVEVAGVRGARLC